MENITHLARTEQSLYLETDAGSMMVVLPGGIIIMAGFLDSPRPVLEHFSERLHHRQGVLYLEFKEWPGRTYQVPLGKIIDTPALQAWLAVADRIVP